MEDKAAAAMGPIFEPVTRSETGGGGKGARCRGERGGERGEGREGERTVTWICTCCRTRSNDLQERSHHHEGRDGVSLPGRCDRAERREVWGEKDPEGGEASHERMFWDQSQ